MKYLLEQRRTAQSAGESEKIEDGSSIVAYVGDSLTDIECLLEAGVGIIIINEGKVSKVKELLEQNKVAVKHVSDFQQAEVEGQTTKWWARDFVEILGSGILRLHTS
jgi:hypothetical protein